jgi:hypothetical protein
MDKKGFLFLLPALILGMLVWTQTGVVSDLERLRAAVPAMGQWESFFYLKEHVWIGRIISSVSVATKILLCVLCSRYWAAPCRRGASYLLYKPIQVVGYGVLGYMMFFTLILIFVLSVLGVPLAALFFVLGWFLTTLGEIPLGLAAGFLFCDSFRLKASAHTYTLTGVLLIEILRRTPLLGYWVSLLLLPVISVGLVITVAYEGYLKKNLCDLSLWTERDKRSPSSVRKIILEGVSKGKRK